MQLAWPLDYSASAPCGLPQNPEPSKRPRSRLLQARLEANLAMLGRLDTVPGSFDENSDLSYFRQGKRFTLMPSLSTFITKVAKFSESRRFVGRRSLPDL